MQTLTRFCKHGLGSGHDRHLLSQRYTQTILVFSTAGVAPGTDPQLRNQRART
jgi:hypothetical protein